MPAMAQGTQASRNAEARAFFDKGNVDYEKAQRAGGDRKNILLANALRSYVASLTITRSKNALYNAAVTLSDLQRWDEAYDYFSEYKQQNITEEEHQHVSSRIMQLDAKIDLVRIVSVPEGATVHVDRRDLASRGKSPTHIAMLPGKHTVWVRLDGYEVAEISILAKAGSHTRSQIELVAKPVKLIVRRKAQGELRLDGEIIEADKAIEVEPGSHLIELNTSLGKVELHKDIAAGESTEEVSIGIPDSLRRRNRSTKRSKRAAIGLFSSAAGVIIAAAALSIKARNLRNDYDRAARALAEDPTDVTLARARKLADRTDRMNIGADTMWATSAALAIGATISLIVHKRRKKARRPVSISVSPSPNGIFVGVRVGGAGL